MYTKKEVFIRILLNRFHSSIPNHLLDPLPQAKRENILNLDLETQDLKPLIDLPDFLLQRIHYTWLSPLVKKVPNSIKPLIFKTLPVHQSAKLGKLDILNAIAPLPKALETYLKKTTNQIVQEWNVLPVEFLPQSFFKQFIYWSKAELVEFIDFLGLYDLANEVRHMIEKNSVNQVYNCLSPKKRLYLKFCLNQKEKLISSKLGLKGWDGSQAKLEALLHQRGLLRLGKSLCGQHPDLMWYIVHILDVGRGNILQKYYSSSIIPKVTPVLMQQASDLIKFLKPEGIK